MAAIWGRSAMMLVPRQGAVLAALEREGRRRKLGGQAGWCCGVDGRVERVLYAHSRPTTLAGLRGLLPDFAIRQKLL